MISTHHHKDIVFQMYWMFRCESAAINGGSEVVDCFIMGRVIEGIGSKLGTKISLPCEVQKSIKTRNQT
jgi:hypothetical protein